MPEVDQLQLDLACAVARMEQASREAGTPLGDLLLMRLATCDAPRLRKHLNSEGRAMLDGETERGAEGWRTALQRAVRELS